MGRRKQLKINSAKTTGLGEVLKEINERRHHFRLQKPVTAARLKQYLRIIDKSEREDGVLATDHTLVSAGFSSAELNAIMPPTEWNGFVDATRLGFKLTSKGKDAIR